MTEELPAVEPPLAVLPSGTFTTRTTTIFLRDKILSYSGADYNVKSGNGGIVCRVQGTLQSSQTSGLDVKIVGFKDTKGFLDPYGRILFTIKKKRVSLHQTYEARDASGRGIFEAKSRFSCTEIATPVIELKVKYRDASDGAWKELEVSGKWTDGGRAYMHRSEPNALLAHISKTNDQSYTLTIAPGVDIVFVTAIAVVFREQSHENRNAWTN